MKIQMKEGYKNKFDPVLQNMKKPKYWKEASVENVAKPKVVLFWSEIGLRKVIN
jgi:predicted HAD superfamily Cof-like phosphohydrolase